jgi:hypothetical protein
MKRLINLLYLPLIFYSFVFLSCSSYVYKEANPALSDGKYDSEFPYRGCSSQLEEISKTIKMVNCITYYKVYVFKAGLNLKKTDLSNLTLDKITLYTKRIETTASGTATVIFSKLNKIALLTTAHIIASQDTLYSYQNDTSGNYIKYLNGILIKERQAIYVPDLPEGGELKILCQDNSLDAVLLSKDFEKTPLSSITVFKYPFGKARELEWGSFVYLFGYPMGCKTLTKALVSSPNRDKSGSFIIDANFNEGFSGGIILAIKDGVPNFELVGMCKDMFADYENLLKPSDDFDYSMHNPLIPYKGEVFVDKHVNIKYGIAKAIPVESIFEFIYTNRFLLNKKGYDFNKLIESYLQLK